ncbi:hypothetical protein Q5752_002368 [Cryptotrichosporon argae]
MVANGTSKRVLKAGVWAPIPAFMDDNEELDVATFRAHVVRLAKAGMAPVVNGSMGEAHHLTAEERTTLIREARAALDEAGLTDTVIIAGTGGNSTRATIQLSKLAAEAGADIAIVIPPGYYSGALAAPALIQFFKDVSSASPLPVMIYNYPGAAGGIDMDSDTVQAIADACPNVCGIKLTCGAVGKLTRITAHTAVAGFADAAPRQSAAAPQFITLGGFADFLLPSIVGGRAHGAIMGLGNIFPHALAHLFELSHRIATADAPSKTDLLKAQQLQDLASEADQSFARAGIAGTKWFLHKHKGYPSKRVRRPLLDFDDSRADSLENARGVKAFLEIENALAKQ